MRQYIECLKTYIANHQPDLDGESVLGLLYECYNEINCMDDDEIKADFNELYKAMHGKTLQEMDEIIYVVCTLCRHHEKSGFRNGIRIGIKLVEEVNTN